jgi:hypothetical protein
LIGQTKLVIYENENNFLSQFQRLYRRNGFEDYNRGYSENEREFTFLLALFHSSLFDCFQTISESTKINLHDFLFAHKY